MGLWSYTGLFSCQAKGKKRKGAKKKDDPYPNYSQRRVETLSSFTINWASQCGITRGHCFTQQSDSLVSLTHSATQGGFWPIVLHYS